ncbi:hypothetical protein A5677_16980 [Mycobacterium malmoense]|uniref:Uncharacterized protein n=1 Tax=Mycobacterium malmoense TaxID=1780 RepID=A0A1B9DAC1_MYCMA|nr:hypothetical protein [Mycobacterium malmoense]OCB57657.1 hypothetical protein A5677_16980 [Mycobacterium malmoense]
MKVIEIESWVRPCGRTYRTYLLPVVEPVNGQRIVIYDGGLCFYSTAVAKLCDEGYHIYDAAVDDPRCKVS